ncbi:MAG TPA: hypothetical protein V6D11_05195 [Waterburya sp.]
MLNYEILTSSFWHKRRREKKKALHEMLEPVLQQPGQLQHLAKEVSLAFC